MICSAAIRQDCERRDVVEDENVVEGMVSTKSIFGKEISVFAALSMVEASLVFRSISDKLPGSLRQSGINFNEINIKIQLQYKLLKFIYTC